MSKSKKYIYLADHAKTQLEHSSSWYNPIEYRTKPETGFTCRIYLTPEDNNCCPLDDKFFYPDRSEYLEDIIERVEIVQVQNQQVNLKPGEKLKMHFHYAGVASSEELSITKVTRKYVWLENEDRPWKFDRKSGKCVNDNNFDGGYRTINTQN